MRKALAGLLTLALAAAGCIGATDNDEPVTPAGEGQTTGAANASTDASEAPPSATNGSATTRSSAPDTNTSKPVPPTPLAAPVIPKRLLHRTIVAVVDTGINPYHEVFRETDRSHPSTYLPEFPADAPTLPLTLGASYAADADKPVWDTVDTRTLYHVPGTKLVGAISFGGRILEEGSSHGTGTAGVLATHAPDVGIVFVQTGPDRLHEATAWAADQPWIDVIGLSWQNVANVPVALGVALATEKAARAGKLVVVSAGNQPTLSITDDNGGPPWVINVGGVVEEQHGEVLVASKVPDVVAEFTWTTADTETVTGVREVSGTSFGAPAVAATLAHAWTALREAKAARDIPGASDLLRDAMNRTAAYWTADDWSPGTTLPMGPAPYVQAGWGVVLPAHGETVAQVALGVFTPQDKGDAVRAFMAARQDARQQLWAVLKEPLIPEARGG